MALGVPRQCSLQAAAAKVENRAAVEVVEALPNRHHSKCPAVAGFVEGTAGDDSLGFSSLRKHLDFDAWRRPC